MDSGEVFALEHHAAAHRAGAGHEVQHTRWDAGLHEYLHQIPAGEQRGRRRFPNNRVAHHDGGHRQIRREGREVEGRDGVNEALERAVLQTVDDTLFGGWLVAVELVHAVDAETEIVDRFARRLDLRLPDALALSHHRRGVQYITVFLIYKFRYLQYYRGALRPRHIAPALVGGVCRRDRALHLFGSRLMVNGELMPVVVRHHDAAGVSRADELAVYDERYLGGLGFDLSYGLFEQLSFGTSGGITHRGFIFWPCKCKKCVVHCGASC